MPPASRIPRILFFVGFTLSVGYSCVFTLLAEMRAIFGFGEWALGVIGGAGFLAGFVAQVALARFADRGYVRGMVTAGLCAALLGLCGMVVARTLPEFVLSRLLLGLGSGTFGPAARRALVTSEPSKAGELLGRQAAWDLAGFLSGPVVAWAVNELFGLRAVFASVALALLALVPFVRGLQMPRSPTSREARVVRTLLARPGVQASLLAALAFYVSVGVFEANWAVLLADRGASQLYISATLSLFALPMLFVAPRGGRLAQQHGSLRVARYSIAAAIPCMLLYGVTGSLVLLTLVVIVHSVVDAITLPANQLAVVQASPPEHIAAGQGLFGATGLAAAALSAMAGGAAYDWGGPMILYTGAGALMTLFLTAALVRGRELLRAPAAAPAPAVGH